MRRLHNIIMDKEKDSFWKRIRYKYRLSVMNEDTLTESWHVRLSRLGVFTLLCALFVLTLALFSVLIIFTPIRNVLPGYSESLRQQLIQQTTQIDSLGTDVQLQRSYLDMIKQIMVGEVSSDSVQSLDSMQIVMREQLLLAKSEVTEEFIAQYEEKGRDNLQLFDIQQNVPTQTFFLPAHGVVITTCSPEEGRFGVTIRSPKNENITAVLSGTVIHVDYEIDNTYTIVLQHATYLSLYTHVGKVNKHVGDCVETGETIGIVDENKELGFELWLAGKCVNPEEVIAF